jgi:hypothetical protein
MMKLTRAAAGVVVLVLLGAGCSDHSNRAAATGNRRDNDVSTTSSSSSGAAAATDAATAANAAAARANAALNAGQIPVGPDRGLGPCGVPPSAGYGSYPTPPGGAFPKPNNDFPMKFVVKPAKADRGAKVRLSVSVTSVQKVVVVILGNFLDQKDHGIELSKFADAKGHADFDVTVPNDAPLGLGRFIASASTRDNKSAFDVQQFIVTGPGCE